MRDPARSDWAFGVGALVSLAIIAVFAVWLIVRTERTIKAGCLSALAGSTTATDTLRVYRANHDCIRLVEGK